MSGHGLRGLTTPLWPIRYKPLPDELLSCWLVRLAHGHGMKVQTFCNLLFGNRLQVWNRDIDRLAPAWLLDALVLHTGTPFDVAYGTTLRVFEGLLYPKFRLSGHLPWIQNLQMYHRTRQGFGQQYCPACLASDEVPYFRKTWRLSLKTFCVTHHCQLLDRCQACGAAVSFHRMDMGRAELRPDAPLSACHACGFHLASAPREPPRVIDEEAFGALANIVDAVDAVATGGVSDLQAGTLAVLRHMTVMMLSKKRKLHLLEYMAGLFGEPTPEIAAGSRPTIEAQSLTTRHALLLWSTWLLCLPSQRLAQAWTSGAFRYNHLMRDFVAPPSWYVTHVVEYVQRHSLDDRSRQPLLELGVEARRSTAASRT
jgi:hypothetical protein